MASLLARGLNLEEIFEQRLRGVLKELVELRKRVKRLSLLLMKFILSWVAEPREGSLDASNLLNPI